MKTLIKKTAIAMSFALALTMGLGSQAAHADWDRYENVSLRDNNFYLSPGQTRTVFLDGWRHVKKLTLRAEANYDSSLDIYANGDLVSNLTIPGRDPGYTITLNQTIRSIEIHNSGSYGITISSISAQQTSTCVLDHRFDSDDLRHFEKERSEKDSHHERDYGFDDNEAAVWANHVRSIVQKLWNYVDYKEQGIYLLPVKKAAILSYATHPIFHLLYLKILQNRRIVRLSNLWKGI